VLVSFAPVIDNAVYDAIGVRIKDMPISWEEVLRVIRQLKRELKIRKIQRTKEA
jgi:hypothetical protein